MQQDFLANVEILVLDFGSQYTQLIARRLREYGVYTEIVPYFEKLESIKAKNPKGIILSGGPASVYEEGAYKPDSRVFELGVPVLGICYGMQYIAHFFGGSVVRAEAQEFGRAVLEILESTNIYQNITNYAVNFSKDFYIAVAQEGDLVEILALQHKAFVPEAERIGFLDIDTLTQNLQSIKQEFQTHIILKCSINGKIVGSVRGYKKGDRAYIGKLFVDNAFVGNGIAQNLIQALESALQAKQYEIFTSIKSVENIARYKRLGYQEFKREQVQFKNGKSAEAVFLEKIVDDFVSANPLFAGVKRESIVWMSHADKVEKIPQGFRELAKSGNTHYCAIADFKRKIYALQFHPEVVHSECGGEILRNFALHICGANTDWNMRNFAENEIVKLRKIVGGETQTFLTFTEACKEMGKRQAIAKLLAIWEDAIEAIDTIHKENKELFIQQREVIEKDYILEAEHILIAKNGDEWLGFVAIKENKITLLFTHPRYLKQEMGFSLLEAAFMEYLQDFLTIRLYSCQWAVEHYTKLGFKQIAEPFRVGTSGDIWLTPLSIEKEKLRESLGIYPPKISRCEWATDKDKEACKLYEEYHDNEWGVPQHDDRKLFEMLVLEGFQAGLSWITILKKRESFREAFDAFDPAIVARYDSKKVESLMCNEKIVRNRAKIEAAICNAKVFLKIQGEFGSFDKYIWSFTGGKSVLNAFASVADLPASTPLSDMIAKDLKKRGFKFVGSTIVYAFMQSIGIVNDHITSCFKRNSSLGMQCAGDFKHCENIDSKAEAICNDFEKKQKSLGRSIVDEKCGLQGKSQGSYLSGNDRSDFAPLPHLSLRDKPTSKVLCAVSGGVDSSVVATLLYRAIGENLIPVFVDTGLLRKGEREAVEKMFRENLKVPLIVCDASELFLKRLKGVFDPEVKRKIIGETFIEVFEKEAKKHNTNGEIKFLAQGTLYPDVIESVSVKGPSKTIKSHHNVGGLPEWMQFKLIEPLRELFKDEVRALGRELGMPESMLMRHPFPGPGLAIRIMGEVNKADLDVLREADSIFIEELHKQGLYDSVWQAFCVLLNVRSVGVMGDNRTYDNTICVRAVEALDGMTATFAHLPHSFLESLSNRIINEVEGINRVVYDITSKPPGTIEWE